MGVGLRVGVATAFGLARPPVKLTAKKDLSLAASLS